jgi:hypothetical protein
MNQSNETFRTLARTALFVIGCIWTMLFLGFALLMWSSSNPSPNLRAMLGDFLVVIPPIMIVAPAAIAAGIAALTVGAARGSRVAWAIIFITSSPIAVVSSSLLLLGRWDPDWTLVLFAALAVTSAVASGFLLFQTGDGPQQSAVVTPALPPEAPSEVIS